MQILSFVDFENAYWAWHPERKEHEAGLTLFKRVIRCTQETNFHLAVSADNRFNFYLDGNLLGRGPLKSCLEHYYYDEYEGHLTEGVHVFAAEIMVWNNAWRHSNAPWSEMHAGGGFFVAGHAGDERMELPGGWRTAVAGGIDVLPWNESWNCKSLIPAPPMTKVDCGLWDYEWMTSGYFGPEWRSPLKLGHAVFHNTCQFDPETPWHLEKRPLPQMLETPSSFAGLSTNKTEFTLESGKLKANCPAGKYNVLLDAGQNQTVMVKISGHGGKGQCRIAYSEILWDENSNRTLQMPGMIGQDGYSDKLIFSDTEKKWEYRSFWYRTGRFFELSFDLSEPIKDFILEINFITYPFKKWLSFSAPNDPVLEKIYQVGCHTLKCCSHEHFEDCPYYEQLQYAGDSRVEALCSYAATGDDSLGRHSLRMFGYSQLSNGMTQSRFPSVFTQIIPVYSLIWALMLYDHYSIFHDESLVRELMPKILFMLNNFENHRRSDGLINTPEGWHFVDLALGWHGGCPDRKITKTDTLHNLFYAETCRRMAELQKNIREDDSLLFGRYLKTADAVNKYCFDPERRRYCDAPGMEWFSLHSNIMALIAGAVSSSKEDFLEEILQDKMLVQPSLYFEFYVLYAIRQYGTREQMRKRFTLWEKMLEAGHTTFPETPYPDCRSLCHAWSCAPVYFLQNSKWLNS